MEGPEVVARRGDPVLSRGVRRGLIVKTGVAQVSRLVGLSGVARKAQAVGR